MTERDRHPAAASFDALARRVGNGALSRRQALAVFRTSLIGGTAGSLAVVNEAAAKKKRRRKKRSPPPPPGAPAPTCSDGLKNGSETGVDCGGGGCLRCGNGQGCASANDCESALCSNQTCLACSGQDSCGPGCFCANGPSGPICANSPATNLGLGSTCDQCPGAGLAYCSQEGLIAYCVYRCGA